MEQRIGRVDRYGEPKPVHNYVVSPGTDSTAAGWWLDLLTRGFEVFDKTTAPIQYAIESVERRLLLAVAADGVAGAAEAVADVKEAVSAEQARIDKLDSLDALARQETDDIQFVNEVLQLESVEASGYQGATLEFLREVASDLAAVAPSGDATTKVRVTSSPPAVQVHSALADRAIALTSDRAVAVARSDLRLLRPGDPVAEAIRAHSDWDDRGQTAAVWSSDRSLEHSILGFRCDVILRADPELAFEAWSEIARQRSRRGGAIRTDADAPLSVAALQRRLDAYLPAQRLTKWLDEAGDLVEEQQRLLLERSYAGSGDERWDDSRWRAVARHAGVLSIDDLVHRLETRLQGQVLSGEGARDASERAVGRARADWSATERILRLRAESGLGASAIRRDLEAETAVTARLLDALAAPRLEWSGAAMVFIEAKGA